MTLEDLRVFVAACEAGNLSALARELGRTQPAVSQHIARLEKELGVKLLERGVQGVAATDAGRALYESALDGLNAIGAGLKQVAEIRDGSHGSVSVTTGPTTVRHFLRTAIARYRRRYPAVDLRFVLGTSTRRCLELLRLEQCDLALVTANDSVQGLEHRLVCRQYLYLLVAPDDAFAKRSRVRIRDLAHIRYIGLSEQTNSRRLIESYLAQEGIALESQLTVDDFDAASLFVGLGLGHAIVPALQAHNMTRAGAVKAVRIESLPPFPIGWVCRRWSSLRGPARDFVDVTQKELRKMRSVPGLQIARG